MSWFSVIIPAVDREAANAALEAEGFGVENFSVPLWRGDEQDPDNYGLNASMDDPAFRAAIEDLPNRSIWDATSGEVEFDQHVAAEGLKREPTPFVDQGLPAE
jgi:hypothetical protein